MRAQRPSCLSCLSKSLSFFVDLDSSDLSNLSSNKICNFYKRGHMVFFEGNTPTGVYCLEQGSVKIFRVGVDGKEQIVRVCTPGGLVGIRSLLSEERYTASAATLEDSVICFISKDFFFRLMNKYPQMKSDVVSYLCDLLKEAEDQIISIAQKSVRERLAATLLVLSHVFNTDKGQAVYPKISIPREDLANIVGTATETVIRILHDFKEEKLVSANGRSITLINIDGLKLTAQSF